MIRKVRIECKYNEYKKPYIDVYETFEWTKQDGWYIWQYEIDVDDDSEPVEFKKLPFKQEMRDAFRQWFFDEVIVFVFYHHKIIKREFVNDENYWLLIEE